MLFKRDLALHASAPVRRDDAEPNTKSKKAARTGGYRSRFFAKARPEADLLYASKAIAFASSERNLANEAPGLVFGGMRQASSIVASKRDFGRAVRPTQLCPG